MHEFEKRMVRAVGLLLFLLLFGGGALFFFFLYGMLAGFPLYVTYGVTALGAVGLLALFLRTCGFLPVAWNRRVGLLFLCAAVAAAGYIAHGFWRDSLPTVDDRQQLLWEYQPFTEGTKTVTLDQDPTLRIDAAAAMRLRLDGATALYPVYAAFVQAVCPEDDYPLYAGHYVGRVACTGTVEAYERLIARETDMIFAAAPSEDQLRQAEKAGMELHLTPIGREAFVFFVNSRNPVTGLTVEQVQGIYAGDITNWKEVGGKNQAIRPFQRAENSGSQSALQRLMGGIPIMEPEEEDRVGSMGGIIRQVASYRNYRNAIGFSFRYYATEMVQNGDIRLLALNGVAPTRETIRDGSYPIASSFYAVTASPKGQPAPETCDETLGALLDWILSDQGQALIDKTGYVSLTGGA